MVTIQLHNDMQCYARSDFTGTLTCKDIMFKGINDGGEGLFYNKLIIQQLLYMLTVECMLCVFAGDFIGHQLNSAVRLCMITVKVMQLGDMIIIMVIGFIDNKDIFKILGQILIRSFTGVVIWTACGSRGFSVC